MGRTIHGLLYTALKSLIDMDPDLYNKCEQEYEQSCLNRQHESEERQHRWQIIEQQALKCQTHPQNDINHITQEMQLDPSPGPPVQPAIHVPERIPEVQEPGESEAETSEQGTGVGNNVRGVLAQEENDTSMSVDPVETVELPSV